MTKTMVLLDWADEVLDAAALEALNEIVQWQRHRKQLRALFDGPGARFAAALVAQACGKPLVVVDRKKLGHVARAILLVDLSRSRSDRAANQQIAYLLQRLEDFPGVVIVTTNLLSALDDAFARRFQAVIQFTAPALPRAKRARRSAPTKSPRRPSRGRSKSPSRARPKT